MSVTAYIALGSNLGDRAELLRRALQALQERPGIEVTQVSTFHETEPVGGPPGQGAYLNAAARLKTRTERRVSAIANSASTPRLRAARTLISPLPQMSCRPVPR